MSMTKKRVLAGVIGLIYAATYGFWTALATGGGHGNFVWFLMFIFVYLFGLYFPFMSILAVDLSSRFIKVIFGGLIVATMLASAVLIYGWISDPEGTYHDFEKMWGNYPGTVLICAVMHFIPNVVYIALLVRSFLFPPSGVDEAPISLDLNSTFDAVIHK